MITRLILSTGEAIYPNFLSKEDREALGFKIKQEGITLQCACRTDQDLFYGISSDLRIIPLHKHYEHAPWCSRFNGEKRNSACVYSDDGTATIHLKFNPLNFSIPKTVTEDEEDLSEETLEEEEEETDGEEKPEEEKKQGPKKEHLPDYNLRCMIKEINHDTYAMRLMSGKFIYLSEEYFLTALLARLKNTYIHGLDKNLRDLSVNDDGIGFFYSKVSGLEETRVLFPMKDGNYGRFIMKPILERAKKDFYALYGTTPETYMKERTLMAAGFVYKRKSKFGKEYKCIGRLCLFVITKNGLFCDSLTERDTVEMLMEKGKSCGGQFLYPDSDDTPVDAIYRIPKLKKEGYVYFYHKPKKAETPYLFCNNEIPDESVIEEFIEEIKR